MNMAAFQDAVPTWAAAGVVPLPIEPNGKRPLFQAIRHLRQLLRFGSYRSFRTPTPAFRA